MKDELFNQQLHQHLDSLKLLKDDNVTSHLKGGLNGSADYALGVAKTLLEKMDFYQVPAHLFARYEPPIYYYNIYDDAVMLSFVTHPQHKKAFNVMLEAGLNIWLKSFSVIPPKETTQMEMIQVSWMKTETLTALIFPDADDYKAVPLHLRESVLMAALRPLEQMPDTQARECLSSILERFEAHLENVSMNRPGISGLEDKNAFMSAKLILQFKGEVTQKAMDLQLDESLVKRVFHLASSIIEIKGQVVSKEMNPAQLKKILKPEQVERIRSLGVISSQCSLDQRLLKMTIEDSDWIEEMPQVLAIPFRGKSFIHQTVLSGNPIAMDWIESSGANIWLASALDNKNNTFHWLADVLLERTGYYSEEKPGKAIQIKSELPQWARIIAYGAHLNGEKDPIEWAIKKADDTIKDLGADILGRANGIAKEYLQELRSQMEKVALSDVLKSRDEIDHTSDLQRGASKGLGGKVIASEEAKLEHQEPMKPARKMRRL